MIRILRRSVN